MAINLRLLNIPPATRATLLTTFLLSLLSAIFQYRLYKSQSTNSSQPLTEQQLAVPYLTLVPAASYFFPWTFITAPFVQQNIVSVLASCLLFELMGIVRLCFGSFIIFRTIFGTGVVVKGVC
jgi:hypothetical protein